MIQSDIMRFLYDPLIGGPPRAYECKIIEGWPHSERKCGAVTRTLAGMRSHQRSVHGFVPQQRLFAKVSAKQNSEVSA